MNRYAAKTTLSLLLVLMFILTGCSSSKTVPPLDEIKSYTEEDFETYLRGVSKDDFIEAWGEPTGTCSETNACIWALDEESTITITFNSNDKMIDSGIGIQEKNNAGSDSNDYSHNISINEEQSNETKLPITDNVPHNNSHNWPTKKLERKIESGATLEVPWADLPVNKQCLEVIYKEQRYSTQATEIHADKIGNLLEAASAKAENYDTNTSVTIEVSLYEINGISDDCAVAVQFKGDKQYYVYVNSYYTPNTLGDLISDLDLDNHISFGSAHYKHKKENGETATIEFEDLEDETVWSMLLSDTTLKNVYNYNDMYVSQISVSVDIPLLGYENIGLSVTEDGYIFTNILNTGKAFYIGSENSALFIDEVINNCTGYELVYIDTEHDE